MIKRPFLSRSNKDILFPLDTYWCDSSCNNYYWINKITADRETGDVWVKGERIILKNTQWHIQNNMLFTSFDYENCEQISKEQYYKVYKDIELMYDFKIKYLNKIRSLLPTEAKYHAKPVDKEILILSLKYYRYFLFYPTSNVIRLIKVLCDGDELPKDHFKCLYTHFTLIKNKKDGNTEEIFTMIDPEQPTIMCYYPTNDIPLVDCKQSFHINTMTAPKLFPINAWTYNKVLEFIKAKPL